MDPFFWKYCEIFLWAEMDPFFWQYCEIPLGIYGFSLNNNNNGEKKKYTHRRIFI